MKPGEVLEGRFTVETLVGSGGSGYVYRARDLETGEPVAVKLLREALVDAAERSRFAREVLLLKQLHHPGLVRYVGHGRAAGGEPYLVMEWLEGETVGKWLRRRPSVRDVVTLGLQIARALTPAHDLGVVHRDLKPANVLLIGNDVAHPKLIDFGLARRSDVPESVTGTGVVLGTPGYMAPEQARGQRNIGPPADVFALGCLLYHCLAGRAPFSGDNPLSVLRSTVAAEPSSLSQLHPGVPPYLDLLIARMMAKDPAARPEHGRAAASLLASLELALAREAEHDTGAQLSAVEQRREVLLVAQLDGLVDGSDQTLLETISGHGGSLEGPLDGKLVAAFAAPRTDPKTAAERAARCALAIRAVAPSGAVAIVTDRVADEAAARAGLARSAAGLAAARGEIVVDETCAGLLRERFFVEDAPPKRRLQAERSMRVARTLLGRQTPLIGREVELGYLEATLRQTIEEGRASVVLVTGEVGVGKSRLRHELIGRAAGLARAPVVWMARGDPAESGSAFGMAAQLLSQAAALVDGEPPRVREAKLTGRLRAVGGDELADACAYFLGQLVGIPSEGGRAEPAEGPISEAERLAARGDAILRGDRYRATWEAWLGAELAQAPVLLVLEDLHWADPPSLSLVQSAARRHANRPLLVLGFARPEAHGPLTKLWTGLAFDRIDLRPLSPKSSAKLVRAVMGEAVDEEMCATICQRAGGNALFLEELIRAASSAEPTDFAGVPETLLALLQGRLSTFDSMVRRVVRAASVFGQTFWDGGVAALLGHDTVPAWLGDLLEGLADAEVVTERTRSRFPARRELVFRHALLREAAYAMLTTEDRRLGHRLAGSWLEGAGETDEAVLAAHLEQGGAADDAASRYRAAGEQALGGNDFEGALSMVRRAAACRGSAHAPEFEASLALVEAEARRWLGDLPLAQRAARRAFDLAPSGSALWDAAAGELAVASGARADVAMLEELARVLTGATDPAVWTPGRAMAVARTAMQLIVAGRRDRAAEVLATVTRACPEAVLTDPRALARLRQAASIRAYFESEPADYLQHTEAAAAAFEQIGDLRNACLQRGNLGHAYAELGDYPTSERVLRELTATAEGLGLANIALVAQKNLGRALGRLGREEESVQALTAAEEGFAEQRDARMVAAARVHLAETWLLCNKLDLAARQAAAALDAAAPFAPMRCLALAVLARIHLGAGEDEAALRVSDEAASLFSQGSGIEGNEMPLAYVRAKALERAGRTREARRLLEPAVAWLRARAAKIPSEPLRALYLGAVDENVQVLALARELKVG